MQILSRSSIGLLADLAAATQHKSLACALQETGVAETHVHGLQEQAKTAGYSLGFGMPRSMGRDPSSTWGRRVAIMIRSLIEPVVAKTSGDADKDFFLASGDKRHAANERGIIGASVAARSR